MVLLFFLIGAVSVLPLACSVVPKTIKTLHYNLGWECMSGQNIGSGKVASKWCTPGYVTADPDSQFGVLWKPYSKEKGAKFRDPPFKRSAEDIELITANKLYDNYMTSCTWRMLGELQKWQAASSFDLISFVELCSPGTNGDYVTGFLPQHGSDYNSRQCSVKTFDLMLSKIFTDHDAFVNAVMTKFGPVSQLTIYSKALGKPDITVATDLTEGRPLSALFWANIKTLFLNVHNVHYRKELIECVPTADVGGTDMCAWAKFQYMSFFNLSEPKDWALAFSASHFNTKNLSILFSNFVTRRISEKLLKKKFCKTLRECVQNLKEWRMIVQGDFNDEIGELFDLRLFDERVHLASDKRVRSCCSDKDEFWTAPYYGVNFTYYSNFPTGTDIFMPTLDTWKYLLADCRYLGNCTSTAPSCKGKFLHSCPDAVITRLDAGAPRPPGAKGANFSMYPFASDLIMDSSPVLEFGFPPGYEQAPWLTISDHDPVVATLAPLKVEPQNLHEWISHVQDDASEERDRLVKRRKELLNELALVEMKLQAKRAERMN